MAQCSAKISTRERRRRDRHLVKQIILDCVKPEWIDGADMQQPQKASEKYEPKPFIFV